jgi:hypothetical protein
MQGDQVRLSWSTAAEVNHYGFKLLRYPEPNLAAAELLHFASAVPGGSGGDYSFIDQPPQGEAWWYWLAEVDMQGRERLHGPLRVQMDSP